MVAEMQKVVVGLGELLWDLLPTGERLGGAPANFTVMAARLGNRGMIASFSRALLEDLRAQMSDAEFNASLGEAIDEIYTASTTKAA